MKKKVLILANSLSGLYNFRKEVVEKLLEENYKVIISSPYLKHKLIYFLELGCEYIETPFNRKSVNPFSDIKLLLRYINILNKVKPDIVLTYTIKPNVYGGLACRYFKIPYIANITGVGASIENRGILREVALKLYKMGLKKANMVFFQNQSNKELFLNKKIVHNNVKLIPGSGVNLERFTFSKYPEENNIINFLFIGRIMKSKGIEELLSAAEIICKKYSNVNFHIVGHCEENYSDTLKEYEKKGIITYHGRQDNVHQFITKSHATINPSYFEGMSNVLLESAATGRPVLASNIPGCRETFDENVSGIGFEVKNTKSLVQAIEKFIKLPYSEKEKMGMAGRRKVEKEFDRNIVINTYLEVIKKTLSE